MLHLFYFAYNTPYAIFRLEDVFGPDTHTFNPDRWLKMTEQKGNNNTTLGVYANLSVFHLIFLLAPLNNSHQLHIYNGTKASRPFLW